MKKIVRLFLTLCMFVLFGTFIYADSNTWGGYGLYNLNQANTTFVSENTKILVGTDLDVTSEYVIRNNSAESTELVVGMPIQNFDSISFFDRGNTIKTSTIRRRSIVNNYGDQPGILPQEDRWKSVKMLLGPNETRALTVKYTKAIGGDVTQPLSLLYFGDRKGNSNSSADLMELTIQVDNYEPYNLISAGDAIQSYLSSDNRFIWQMTRENVQAVKFSYQDVWQNLINTYQQKDDKILRDIANSLARGEYSKVIDLCASATGDQHTADADNIRMFQLEAYKAVGDAAQFNQLYHSVDYNKLSVPLSNKLIADRIKMLTMTGENSTIKKEINSYIKGHPDNVYYNKLLMETEDKIQEKVEESVDKTVPVNKDGKNTFFIKIAQSMKGMLNYLRSHILVVILLVVLIVLIIIYMIRRRKNRRRTIRFR